MSLRIRASVILFSMGTLASASSLPQWSPDGKLLVMEWGATQDHSIVVWDVLSRKSTRLSVKMGIWFDAFALNPTGKTLAVAGTMKGAPYRVGNLVLTPNVGNELIDIIDLATGDVIEEIDTNGGKGETVYFMVWSADGGMIALAVNSTVRVWNVKNKKVVYEAPNKQTNTSPVDRILWRNDVMVWRREGVIRFWQLPANENVLPPITIPRTLDMDWNKATNLFALITDRLIIYDPVAAKITAQSSQGGFSNVSWSPDGQSIAVARQPEADSVFIYNSSARLVRTIPVPQSNGVGSVSWSPDGSTLLVHTGHGFSLVNASTGKGSVLVNSH